YILESDRSNPAVMLFEYGTYAFRLTVRDADGQIATREVSYTKVPTPVRFEITPRDARVPVGGTVQFQAIGYDDRGNRIPDPIGVGWYVWQGPGTIDPNGLYTAPPDLSGAVTIHAERGLSDGIHAPIPMKDEVAVVIEPAVPRGGAVDFKGGF